jgi:hypothetical protein
VLCDQNTPRKLGITVQEGVQFKKKKKREKNRKNTYIFEGEVPKYRPVLETHIEVPAGTSNPS